MPTWHGDGSGICRLEDRSRGRQPCSFLRRSGLCARRQVSPAPDFAQARAKLLVILPSLSALTNQFALLSAFVCLLSLERHNFLRSACYAESGKGDPSIRSTALGLLKSGINRSQIEAFTVP